VAPLIRTGYIHVKCKDESGEDELRDTSAPQARVGRRCSDTVAVMHVLELLGSLVGWIWNNGVGPRT
jgi:hypothetical protein